MDNLIQFCENTPKDSFSQNPRLFFEKNNLTEYLFLISDNSIEETKKNIFTHLYGKGICDVCGGEVNHIKPGWKGWNSTCSKECLGELRSKRMRGSNNSYHKLSEEQKKKIHSNQSETLKRRIQNGEITPRSENYRCHKMIRCDLGEVRSLWEVFFWKQNPHLEYETIRIPYYDTDKKKERIYIVDFYDRDNNTLYEVKPKKYQYQLQDKMNSIIDYKYQIIDEDYFINFDDDFIKETLIESVIECDNFEDRLNSIGRWRR